MNLNLDALTVKQDSIVILDPVMFRALSNLVTRLSDSTEAAMKMHTLMGMASPNLNAIQLDCDRLALMLFKIISEQHPDVAAEYNNVMFAFTGSRLEDVIKAYNHRIRLLAATEALIKYRREHRAEPPVELIEEYEEAVRSLRDLE